MSQLPDLPNGCEVTSLAMLLGAVGQPVDKNVLADQVDRDPSQPVFAAGAPPSFATITRWDDPADGFVGNIRVHYGYRVYHHPSRVCSTGTCPAAPWTSLGSRCRVYSPASPAAYPSSCGSPPPSLPPTTL